MWKSHSNIIAKLFNRAGFNYSSFNRRIYLDYASLTPIDPRVIREMVKYSSIEYANPSSFYKEGIAAKKALADGRIRVANFIHSLPDEIVFTSGGTESNNLALKGAVESLHEKGVRYEDMHVIISAIEHSSVRECANYFGGIGVAIDTISVDKKGVVYLEELKKKIRMNTVIISIMTVNNEIGSIQPIREIAKIVRQFRDKKESDFDFQSFQYPILHTDASQAALYEDLNVQKLGVDLLTIDGTKVYGPRGIGLLYIRRETPIASIVHGGGQESLRRSGTENIPAIMGLAKALDIASVEKEKEAIRISGLKYFFIDQLKMVKSGTEVNGYINDNKDDNDIPASSRPSSVSSDIKETHFAPHILNVSIPKIDNEFFVMRLDAKGICCSTKSSCLRDEDESYVLQSIGVDSKHSIRFSFGRWTKKSDLEKTLNVIKHLA